MAARAVLFHLQSGQQSVVQKKWYYRSELNIINKNVDVINKKLEKNKWQCDATEGNTKI